MFYYTFIFHVACTAAHFERTCSKPCPPGFFEKMQLFPFPSCLGMVNTSIIEFDPLKLNIFFFINTRCVFVSRIIYFLTRYSNKGVSKTDVISKRPTETMLHVVIVIKRTCKLKKNTVDYLGLVIY